MTNPYPSPIPDEFAGRRALVTGGSRGIGAAIAELLLDGGASVVTSARTQTEDTPGASTFIPGDVRTSDGARRLVDQALETLGGLDILINNAGAARVYPSATAIPEAGVAGLAGHQLPLSGLDHQRLRRGAQGLRTTARS